MCKLYFMLVINKYILQKKVEIEIDGFLPV